MRSFFIISIRILLGTLFFTSGMSKVFFEHRFPGVIGPSYLQEELAQYGLDLYASFIAFVQILIGVLLLTQRFATLGSIMLFPMLLNILVVTISLKWYRHSYISGGLLILNTYLLFAEQSKLKFIFIDSDKKLAHVPFSIRRLPFHDAVFVIGLLCVLASPLLSFVNVWLAYLAAGFGLIICGGIEVYEKRIVKNIVQKKDLPYL